MELLQLKYFCDAANSENFSATAKKYMVPPSAISQSIKRLEKELGTPLFIRQANRIKLSTKGAAFYEKVSVGLHMLTEAKNEACCDEDTGTLKLSIFINRRLVMQTVEKFSRQYPQVNIITKYTIAPDQEDFDLIITDVTPQKGTYSATKLTEEEILLAIHKAHPLASQNSITPHQLAELPFICTNRGSSLHRITEQTCQELGFSPRIVIFSDDPYYIRKCVELGLGAAFIPAVSWHGQFSENVTLKKIGNASRSTYAFRDAQKLFSKHARLFLKMLQEEFAEQSAALQKP